jgi:hypothetical protein
MKFLRKVMPDVSGAMEAQMVAIARAFARAFPISISETLTQLLLFGCAGLLVSVLLMTYGVDLSPGFF